MKFRIRNDIMEKAASPTGPWSTGRILPKERKGIPGILYKGRAVKQELWQRWVAWLAWSRASQISICIRTTRKACNWAPIHQSLWFRRSVLGVQELAFLTSFWVMLMEVVQGPQWDYWVGVTDPLRNHKKMRQKKMSHALGVLPY